METIEVKYSKIGSGYFHKYLVYTDMYGNQYAARGGPSEGGASGSGSTDASSAQSGWPVFGDIRTDYGNYNADFFDYDVAGDDPGEVVVFGNDLSGSWNEIINAMDQIEAEGHEYRPFDQNSNTTVDEALRRANLPEPILDEFPGNWAPGSANDLNTAAESVENNRTFSEYVSLITGWTEWTGLNVVPLYVNLLIENLGREFAHAEETVSPLILDLDGDGVETIAVQQGIHFDHDGNTIAEQTGWVSSDDGLLVLDRNGNGIIDNGGELFGNNTVLADSSFAENGFAALAELDSNGDDKIDVNDSAFSQLRIWRDIDSDGVTDAGELITLADAGAASLSLSYISSEFTDQSGNQHLQQGSFTSEAGASFGMSDVWFVDQGEETEINSTSIEVDAQFAALPDIAGFGDVESLHTAMQNDSSGELLGLVSAYVVETDPTARADLLNDIIYTWAGVDDVSQTSRGSYFPDARKLAALEAFMGKTFVQGSGTNAGTTSPGPNSTETLLAAYEALSAYVSSSLLASSQHESLYQSIALAWDANGERLVWDVAATVTKLQAAYASNPVSGVQLMKEFASGLQVKGAGGEQVLEALRAQGSLTGSGFEYELATLGYSSAYVGTASNDTYFAQGGNDLLVGSSGADTLHGNTGNDAVYGGEGDDHLQGNLGDDVIDGGAGNDHLSGGDDGYYVFFPNLPTGNAQSDGDDTFIYERGGGHDTIHQVGAYYMAQQSAGLGLNDVVRFGAGVSIEDVVLSVDASRGVLIINFRNPDGSIDSADSLTIDGYYLSDAFYSTPRGINRSIAEFQFESGATYSAREFEALLLPSSTANDDFIDNSVADVIQALDGNDTVYSGQGNDVIDGGNGNDHLHGEVGDDTLSGADGTDRLYGGDGNDVLIGGTGDDWFVGGSGSDTYVYNLGDGRDVIASLDISPSATDVLVFGEGISPNDLIVNRASYDSDEANIYFKEEGSSQPSVGASIGISSLLSPTKGASVIDEFHFHDGTVWSLQDFFACYLNGTEHSDTIRGFTTNDQISGASGDDRLFGDVGNDTITGGVGWDRLFGGEGDDTYRFGYGGMRDEIYDKSGSNRILFETDVGPSGVTLYRTSSISEIGSKESQNYQDTGDHLVLVLAGSKEQIWINNYFGLSGSDYLREIAFADGTVWDAAAIAAQIVDMGGVANSQTGTTSNNSYAVDNSKDTISESSNGGVDLVTSTVSYTLGSNVENLTLTGELSISGTGNSLANTIVGNAASNVLDGKSGSDTLIGGAGDDIYYRDSSSDVITEVVNEGYDTVFSSVSYTLSSNVEALTLTGSNAVNGTGNVLSNNLVGNRANNTLDGGSGADVMAGLEGADTYLIDNAADIVVEEDGAGLDIVKSSISYALGKHVENLTLTGTAAINGIGTARDNVLTGNSANNTLTGNAGNDTLDGGSGADTMVGGTGNDIYYVNASGDVTTENDNEGIDLVNSTATYTLASNIELLFLKSTSTINGTGNAFANLLRGNSAKNTLTGGGGTDILEGGVGIDTLSNSSGNTLLNGGSGNDILTGASNNDLLIGGTGNDALTTGSGADIIVFNKGDGQDTVAASTTKDNTLSIGGGAGYAELLFQKSGNNLILKVGTDQITFTDYYLSTSNRSVDKLQVVLEGSSDYNAASSDPLYNKKIETFDFGGLVAAFDAALAANPSLTSWALSNALVSQYLSSSDTAALGGDLAYQYGRYGSVSNVSFTPAIGILGASGFGTTAQTLQSLSSLQDSSPRLS